MATDKETNARLLRVYGISLIEYEAILEQQNFCCAICSRPPGAKRLHVDHCHKFVRRPIAAMKLSSGKWTASTDPFEAPYYEATGSTKSEAKKAVKKLLIRGANRGLLCWKCNTSLQKFADNPLLMESAARYIRNFTSKHQGDSNGK